LRSRRRGGARETFVRHLLPFERVGLLSRSERAIVRLSSVGQTLAEIAEERGTSVRTVANQLSCVRRKLGKGPLGRAAPRLGEMRRGRAFWLRLLSGELRVEKVVMTGAQIRVVAMRTEVPRELLSPREQEILALATGGCRTKEISRDLGIAPTSVQTYIRRGLHKLRLTDRGLLEAFGLIS
jgi:DNA-binding CsgD family transcriptional regulator